VFTGGGIDPILADGMIAAQLADSYGRISSDQIACGLFLLSLGVRYPLRKHAGEKIISASLARCGCNMGLKEPRSIYGQANIPIPRRIGCTAYKLPRPPCCWRMFGLAH
jgi:hypothetical protein